MKLRKLVERTINEYLNEISKTNNKVLAYHGTPHGIFDKFSMRKRGTGADIVSLGDYGKGFYFTPKKEHAIGYANGIADKRNDIKNNNPTLYTVNLTMNKPFDMGLIDKIDRYQINLVVKYGIKNIPEGEYEKIYSELNLTEDDVEFYRYVADSMDDNWGDWDIKTTLKSRGFDSVIANGGDEYIVYDPKQIEIINVETL